MIEDDLANLKRLQQENTPLKAQLGNKLPEEMSLGLPPRLLLQTVAAHATPPPARTVWTTHSQHSGPIGASTKTPMPKNAASDVGVQDQTPEKAAASELQTDSSGGSPLKPRPHLKASSIRWKKASRSLRRSRGSALPPRQPRSQALRSKNLMQTLSPNLKKCSKADLSDLPSRRAFAPLFPSRTDFSQLFRTRPIASV